MLPNMCKVMKRIESVVCPWLFLFAVLIQVVDAGAADEEVHPIDAQMQAASERDASTAGEVGAIQAALKQWDASLNEHYESLLEFLDPAAANALRESQRQWIVWRDLELKSLDAYYERMEGTMWQPVRAYARMNLTRQRALALQRLDELIENRTAK